MGTVVAMGKLQSMQCVGVKGDVLVPGDKSISHRALMLSSQVLGSTRVHGLLEGEDVLNTARALRALGVTIERITDGEWRVQGVGVGGLHEASQMLDMGNAGTGTRLLMGLLTPYPFTSFFTGDASLCSRPMARVMLPLEQMGACFASRTGGRLPLALLGTTAPLPINYRLPVASAQVKSAILLAGLNTPGITTVVEPIATRDHTENMLGYFGFVLSRRKAEDGAIEISVRGQQEVPYADREFSVPADPSSAAFVAVAALITKNSNVTLKNVCMNPLRTGLFATLEEMGASIEILNRRSVAGEDVADMRVRSSKLKAVNVSASRAPSMIDEYPILAVAAAFAEGESVMEGLGELKVKESDRLSAIVEGLQACGITARAEGETLRVKGTGGTPPRGGKEIKTRFDHRIAMAFLVMGLGCEQPVTIDDESAIGTSFPNFATLMNRLGAHIAPPVAQSAPASLPPLVIAIDGPAASGKGTLARRIAEYLDAPYLDTGSLYRAVGLKLVYGGHDSSNVQDAVAAARGIDADDLTNPRLRQERIGQAASVASAMPEVRAALLEFQRKFACNPKGAVLDGRDIGTVVCPEADFKFFLTASLEARAKRRHRELSGQGIEVVYDSVLEDLRERDARDSQRSVAPLKPALDAMTIDTSHMDANTVFEHVRTLIVEKSEAKLRQKRA